MRTLVIDANNRVVDAIMTEAGYEVPGFKVVASDVGGPGDLYDPATGEFSPPSAPPAPPPAPRIVYKADIWRRCTDDEATQLDAALAQQPVRMRRMFDDAQFLSSGDELFGEVKAAVTQLVGADRAAALLAPST